MFVVNDKNDSFGNKNVCGVEGKCVNMFNLFVFNFFNWMNYVYKYVFK